GSQGPLQALDRLCSLDLVELEDDLFGLCLIFLDPLLGLGAVGDLLAQLDVALLDLVKPLSGLELQLILVEELREQESAPARRNRPPVDDLHPVEGFLKIVDIGPHVAQVDQVSIRRLRRDSVFEELKSVQWVAIEFPPE